MPITRARLEYIAARLNQYTPAETHGDNVLDATLGISVSDLHLLVEAARVGLPLLPLPDDPIPQAQPVQQSAEDAAPAATPAGEDGATPEPPADAAPAPEAEQAAGDPPHEEPPADDAPPAAEAQGEPTPAA